MKISSESIKKKAIDLGFEKIIYSKVLDNQIIIKSSEDISNHPLKISFSKDKVLFFDKNKNRIR